MEVPVSPTSNDANNFNTALPLEDDSSFYLKMIRDALLQDDITFLQSVLFEVLDGNNTINSNSVSRQEKKRRREGEEYGGEDTDSSPSGKHRDGLHAQRSPSPRLDISPAMLEEQGRAKRQQEPTLFEANHEEYAEDMAIYGAHLRDPNDDQGESEGVRSKRAKIAPAAEGAAASVGSDVAGVAGVRGPTKPLRRLKQQPRISWWDRCNSPDFPEAAFRKAFRMSRATFYMICDELSPVMTRRGNWLRPPIPVRQSVAACLWRLATGDPLDKVSKRFGLGIGTCHLLVSQVCAAINSVLSPKFLKWPSDAALEEMKGQFASISGIPNIVGSMHTTHIPIIAPRGANKNSVAAYLNKRQSERCHKSSYSITIQGVVGPDGVFSDVCIGWPGSMADDEVLEKSALYQRAMDGMLKDQWIVGGAGYPLLDWLLVAYAHQNLAWTQQAFNEITREVQRVAKDAFARLKARWRCTLKTSKVKPQELQGVLRACCVLHNICEMRNEEMDPELRIELESDEIVPDDNLRPESDSAAQARDMIAHKLFHHDLAGLASWLVGGT